MRNSGTSTGSSLQRPFLSGKDRRLDEALRIRREEEIEVYQALGYGRSLLIAHANLAAALRARFGVGDKEEADRLLTLALAAA